jgi:RNA polymerase sigma factor (sigma-70 family)
VWAVVASLAPRQREAVVLRYLADLDEAQIARIMGVTRSSVSSALTRAHRQLAAMLASDEEPDRG